MYEPARSRVQTTLPPDVAPSASVMSPRAPAFSTKIGAFGRSRARRYQPTGDRVTFADVAGVEEAESELVAGFMVEYSSTPYMLFMLGEYVAIVLMCALGTVLFLGGWLPPVPIPPFTWVPGVLWFVLKVCFLFFLIAMVKAMVPRYRYDQLMRLGWKVFLPLSLAMVVIVAAILKLWQHST